MTRIVIIQGSPRNRGNCATLAQDAVSICEEMRATTRMVRISDLENCGCTGCMNCIKTGKCSIADRVQPIYDAISNAQGVLWISPLYFSSIPSQLKALVDRFQLFWARRLRGEVPDYHARRPASLILIGGGMDPFGYQCAVTPIRSASNLAELTLRTPIPLIGPDEIGDMSRDEFATLRRQAHEEIRGLVADAKLWYAAQTKYEAGA